MTRVFYRCNAREKLLTRSQMVRAIAIAENLGTIETALAFMRAMNKTSLGGLNVGVIK